ncbi:hypothetical protein B0H15DRAFT_805738 [Mycena belliarum]|uniref:Uncharacterized protein n=1 Tax=Mycena belliarum TaxID=1033014 RepID=A0AAD6TQL8_9AGAR|nr:hypothetical protein B0H15DRAFT_805738 [Mycena belliae]
MPSALSPPSWASGMVVTCLSHSPLAAHSSRDFSWEGLGIGGALSMIFFSSAALPALGVWDPTPGASAHVAFPGSSSAALPALGLWDLTPGPSAHFGCSGSSSAALPALGLWDLTPNPSAHVGCSGSSERLLDASERGRMFHRRHISHALASPGPIARSLLPESPVSFRSTADSPIHEISNEIMAPMTMRPLVSTPLQIWGATLGLLVHCYRSEVRIGRESTSESQHRRLTSLASTGAKSSPTQAFRPPFTSTIQFDLNQTPAFVLTATIRFKSSLKRPFDLTAWFDFKFKG